MKKLLTSCACILFLGASLYGDVIIEMTAIGDAGNSADWTGLGSVNYTYQISTYEVTVAQYTEFLNAVAASDPYRLYSDNMGSDPLGASIIRGGAPGSYTYTAVAGKENEPVRSVDFYDACRFSNWLANGQGSGDTEAGSYTLSLGVDITRTANATWVIPSEDEWYKAAYYDPVNDVYYDYPNGSDAVPAEPTDGSTPREMNFGDYPYWEEDGSWVYYTDIGETTGQSPYGAYDMGGECGGVDGHVRSAELPDHQGRGAVRLRASLERNGSGPGRSHDGKPPVGHPRCLSDPGADNGTAAGTGCPIACSVQEVRGVTQAPSGARVDQRRDIVHGRPVPTPGDQESRCLRQPHCATRRRALSPA